MNAQNSIIPWKPSVTLVLLRAVMKVAIQILIKQIHGKKKKPRDIKSRDLTTFET